MFDEKSLKPIQEALAKSKKLDEEKAEKFWQSLSYEDKCHAFQAIVSRIHKGDVIDQGSYRYVLYDVFGFWDDMYVRGMNCGYMDIHNLIVDGLEKPNRTWTIKEDIE